MDPKAGLLSDAQQLKLAPSQAYINCSGITVGLPKDPVTTICGNFYNGNDYTSNPAGVAVAADSKTAYVILNQNNTLQAVDLTQSPAVAKGTQVRVGNAPNSVVLWGKYAYVSNEGGRVATASDFTNTSSGTPIVASHVNGSAVTGTVSVAYVTLYTANAVAIVDLSGGAEHAVLGLVPTASTPCSIVVDAAHHQLIVSNDKGLGTWGSQTSIYGVTGYNSHQDTAPLDFIPLPDYRSLGEMTQQVYKDNHWDLAENAKASGRRRGGRTSHEWASI